MTESFVTVLRCDQPIGIAQSEVARCASKQYGPCITGMHSVSQLNI